MRIQLFSDLHLEYRDFIPPKTEVDVVVLAGDIHNGPKALPWIARHFSDVRVLYLMGNHEYYGERFPDVPKNLVSEAPENVTILENTCVDIGEYRFLGCTLWTDFNLYETEQASVAEASHWMSDYQHIRSSARDNAKLHPDETRLAHINSLNWLRSQLEGQDNRKTIVVTHHAPSALSLGISGYLRKVDPAYASNLDPFIEEHRPLAWLHGHTHEVRDYVIGETRILSNPGGYRPDEKTGFDEKGVFEL